MELGSKRHLALIWILGTLAFTGLNVKSASGAEGRLVCLKRYFQDRFRRQPPRYVPQTTQAILAEPLSVSKHDLAGLDATLGRELETGKLTSDEKRILYRVISHPGKPPDAQLGVGQLARDKYREERLVRSDGFFSGFAMPFWSSDVLGRVESDSERGPRILLKRRLGRSWYADRGKDPMGDPRWIVKYMGPELAKFFGFELISRRLMLVPTAERLNWAIDRINSTINRSDRERFHIPVRYLTGNEKLNYREYVAAFATHGAIPLDLVTHDHSYHWSLAFLPDEVSLSARSQSQAVLDWEHFLKTEHPDFVRRPAVSEYLETLFQIQSRALDLGSGNFSASYFNRRTRALYQFGYEVYAWKNRTPQAVLERASTLSQARSRLSLQTLEPPINRWERDFVDPLQTTHELTEQELDELNRLLKAFLASQPPDSYLFHKSRDFSETEFLDALRARRIYIESVAKLFGQ